jgi:LemA protein
MLQTALFPPSAPTPRRGALSAGLVILIALALVVLMGGGCAVGQYNSMVSGQETVDQKFSDIDNQYKRRNDLIPQLLATVKGSADFEERVLTDVAEARASVGRLQIPAQASSDPRAAADYLKAQQGLGAAVGRMLMTAENYPTLKSTSGFRDMQSQVEGTENRIAVARTDYIASVKGYNTTLRKFPGNMIAGTFGFERLPQLEAATSAEREVPTIDFSK